MFLVFCANLGVIWRSVLPAPVADLKDTHLRLTATCMQPTASSQATGTRLVVHAAPQAVELITLRLSQTCKDRESPLPRTIKE